MVYELDENEMISDYPDAEPIPLALVECTLNPAFLARLVHTRFPVRFEPVTKIKDDLASDFYQLEDMPIKPPNVSEYEGLERVWFGFSKQVSMTLDDLWIPDEYQLKTKMIIKITNACIANVGTILEISENGFVEIMLYFTTKV